MGGWGVKPVTSPSSRYISLTWKFKGEAENLEGNLATGAVFLKCTPQALVP